MITTSQIKQLQTIMSSRFSDRDERLDFISNHLNRKVLTTKDLTSIEADELIFFLNTGKVKVNNWGYFDVKNRQHRNILSLMRQANWTVPNDTHGEVPDLERLSNFLKSPKSPVNKPLKQMESKEVSKIISAFEGIVNYIYK